MKSAHILFNDGSRLKVKFKRDSPGTTPIAKPGSLEIPTQYTIWYNEAWQRVYKKNTITEHYLFIKPDLRVNIVDK